MLLALSLAACAPRSPRDRASVSTDLIGRAGHGLRTEKGTETRLPAGVSVEDGLTENEAVAVALWNNATFQADLAALGLARADLIDAGMIRNPLFTLFFPLGPKQLEFTAAFPLEAIWQRPRRVDAAKREVERVAASLVGSGLDLVRNVKLAYADLALARDRERLGVESAKLRARIASIAQARLRAGDASQLESSAVALDARRAELDVIRLRGATEAADERLRLLLGLDAAVFPLAGAPETRTVPEPADSMKRALALRPDLRAAELAIEALAARRGWEKSKTVPLLAALADANGSGKNGFEIGPGFQLEIPIFNQNQGPIARADAELERAAWTYVAVRQRVASEVREAIRQYRQAQAELEALRTGVLAGWDENIGRAEQAYAAGEVPHLFVLETARQRLDAQVREVELTADLRRAAAELDRSVGSKNVEK